MFTKVLAIRIRSSWSASLFFLCVSVLLHAEALTVWLNVADWGQCQVADTLFNPNCHRLLFILNCYSKWGTSVILYTPPPPTFFCRKLREYSARSYWSTAERCENRQPASIGLQAERTCSPLLFCRQADHCHWGALAVLISSKKGL